jgi:SAM-dependent methyltransferase
MADREGDSAATYQFGDSELAAKRLERLADVFNPSSRAFLQSLRLGDVREVADLGCGPGHTTRMLAEVFPTANVLGIDCSSHFIELARRTRMHRVRYAVGDVTQPLSGGPFNVIYCRYLLAHLSQPLAVVQRWSEQLRPGGHLCLEENDWIHTTQPAFARYLEIVTTMLDDAAQTLVVGRALDRFTTGIGWKQQSSIVIPVVATERVAAQMFLPNLANWRDRPFIRQHYATAELDRLRDQLQQLVDEGSQVCSISFGLRRLVLVPTGSAD